PASGPVSSWLRRWRTGASHPARPRRAPLALESLEERAVPALTVTQVKALNTLAGSNISQGVNLNGTLIFSADDGVNGQELWKSDGTAAGTVPLKDIFTGKNSGGLPNSSSPNNLTVVGSVVFFTADNGVNGQELWKTDGTTAG